MSAAPRLEAFSLRLRLRSKASKRIYNHIFIIFRLFGSYLFTTQRDLHKNTEILLIFEGEYDILKSKEEAFEGAFGSFS